MIPRLTTARLLLREPRVSDFDEFARNGADASARVHSGGTIDARDAWRRFHAGIGYWFSLGMGWWMVEKQGLAAIGSVGVFRSGPVSQIEIGWSIYRQHWNNGYATEAARAALDFALGTLATDRVVAHIVKMNVASVRVATKIGMRCEGTSDVYGETDWLYVRER
jgi:RimJ/RimL family protein N-acetyltransferase